MRGEMRRVFPVWGVLLALMAGAWGDFAWGAKPERLYPFRETVLDNGLRVITLEDFSTPIVAAQVWFHVGSKNEPVDRRGFAHLFEHMMFRGTDLVGPEQHMELLRRIGGESNAFTSFDYTAYVNTAPANQVELPFWLEADRMMYLKIDEEGFAIERKVVEEELRQDYNEPYGTIVQEALPHLFETPAYQWPPIGNVPHLRAATAAEAHAFWDRYYVPGNAVLVVSGAVRHGEALRLAERYFGWMPAISAPAPAVFAEPEQSASQEVTLSERLGPAPMAGFMYRGVPEGHPDEMALQVLMIVLGGGDSSRLYRDLVQERRAATQVMAEAFSLERAGLFGAGAAILPGGDIDAALAAVGRHFDALVEAPISADELMKAQNRLRRDVVMQTLTVEGKARMLGRSATVLGDAEYVNRELARIEKVTVEDVWRVARAYVVPARRTTLRIVPAPEASPVDPDALRVADADGTAEENAALRKGAAVRPEWYPKQPPLKPLLDALPRFPMRRHTLANGLQVVVAPNREAPFVSAMLGFRYGAYAEDSAAPGTASVAMAMLSKGTQKRTAAQLAELLDLNALALGGAASLDDANVTASGLSDKASLLLDLMAEVVTEPVFPEDEFSVLQEQRRLSLSIQEQDARYLAERVLRRVIFSGHPYERSPEGELQDVAAVTLEGVKAWWKTYLRPDAAILYIAGDVKPREAIRFAARSFGGWRAEGPAPEVKTPATPEQGPTRIYLVDKPGAVQSQIRIGAPTLTRGNPDYHYSRVFTQIYGGSMGSRLSKWVRVKQGLTYSAAGGVVPRRFSGTFWTYTFTRTSSTAEAVSALLDVVRGMRTEPPAPEELDVAKSYLVGSFPGQLETPQDAIQYQWVIDSYGLPRDYLVQAIRAYGTSDASDVQRVAEKVIDLDRMTIVVVGDAASIAASLEKIAPVTLVPASVPAPAE